MPIIFSGTAGPLLGAPQKGRQLMLHGSTPLPAAANVQDIAPDSIFIDSDTFFTPTVSATYTLLPALYVDPDTFYAATITTGPVNLAPGLFTDPDTFYAPVVSSLYTLAPALFVDSDTFYAATVTSVKTLAPSLFVDPDTFFAPVVSAIASIAPSLYIDPDTFYSPTVTNVAVGPQLLPSLFVNTNIFYSPAAYPTRDIAYVRLLYPHVFDGVLIYANTIIGGPHPIPQGFHFTTLMEPHNAESADEIARVRVRNFGRYDLAGNLIDNPPIIRPIWDAQPTPTVGQ